jgi:hypothetical protein
MFRLYRGAVKCSVYLSDVSARKRDNDAQIQHTWESAFRSSRWFTRGWTLQQLLAPESVEIFSREEELISDKKTLEQQLHEHAKYVDFNVKALEVSLEPTPMPQPLASRR